jgi:exportin-1
MYVVGQYPRFLRAHWKFLKTVVNKLFEFMHETHEGVQDMACDTFIKIAQKCRRHFITIQLGESQPFVDEILTNINGIICHLEPHQVHTFYEAVGNMIAASVDVVQQTKLIEKYMQLPNDVWNTIITEAKKSVDCLKDPEVVSNILNILKTNIRASKALGAPYVHQLIKIYQDMLHIYKVTSENINQAIRINGPMVVKQRLIKSMMAIKEDTLSLLGSYFSKANNIQQILDQFLTPLFTFVLVDYRDCHPEARESEVLNMLATLINKIEGRLINRIPEIFDLTFEHTLHMIDKNFEDFPDHRKNFYILLQSVANVCFTALLALSATQFKLVYDSIMWALKHTMRTISELGLEILQTMLRKFQTCDPQAAQNFYQVYYLETMQHIFAVVAECSHTSGMRKIFFN